MIKQKMFLLVAALLGGVAFTSMVAAEDTGGGYHICPEAGEWRAGWATMLDTYRKRWMEKL
ncbi:hypothetical protein [Pseudomonas sp. TWI929]|uniref:hypothetical protein n=1 Tax=Pseudomonas sp. TWI929 TaxID=3136795 RepID=UPI003209DF55